MRQLLLIKTQKNDCFYEGHKIFKKMRKTIKKGLSRCKFAFNFNSLIQRYLKIGFLRVALVSHFAILGGQFRLSKLPPPLRAFQIPPAFGGTVCTPHPTREVAVKSAIL